jgi:pyrimidine deaminase RibD-like protein
MRLRWYRIALRISRASCHTKYKMAAILVRGNTILSTAVNGKNRGEHAERRVLRHPLSRGATIYIAREGRKMSMPCPTCMKAIRNAGVERIIFANWSRELVCQE